MAGLLEGVLPWVYSKSNALQRKANGLLSDPMGEIEQAAGLLQDSRNQQNKLMEAAFSDPRDPFRVTNKNAMAALIDNTMQGPMGFAPIGMAQLVKPLGTGPHYATDNLGEYTAKLYRETSSDRAVDFLPNSMTQPQTLWFSNEPAYALGQGANRGVLMEFGANGIPGQLSLKKPMAREAYEKGNAEFVSQDALPSQIGSNLLSIRISKEQQKGPYFRRMQGLLKDWNALRDVDGTLVLTRPD